MKKIIFLIVLILFITGCKSLEQKKFEQNPLYESFYQTTRFIMTKYEKNMYKYLPDDNAREQFIKEFWLRRDPTPSTEENENYDDFQNRIQYANKHFRERTKGFGWNTIRGRILLQLGFPIDRRRDHYNLQTQTRAVPYEIWYYPRFELGLTFIDRNDSGKFELFNPPPGLLSSIDEAIYEFDINKKFWGKSSFKFKAKYSDNGILLNLPTKNILYREEDGYMSAEFQIEIIVYLDFKKIDKLISKKIIKEKKEDILKMNKIKIHVKRELKQKGKYYFDILVTDIFNKSRYRRFVSYKN